MARRLLAPKSQQPEGELDDPGKDAGLVSRAPPRTTPREYRRCRPSRPPAARRQRPRAENIMAKVDAMHRRPPLARPLESAPTPTWVEPPRNSTIARARPHRPGHGARGEGGHRRRGGAVPRIPTLFPNNANIQLALARTLSWSKNSEQRAEAERLLTAYLLAHPDSPEALLLRARVRSWQGTSRAPSSTTTPSGESASTASMSSSSSSPAALLASSKNPAHLQPGNRHLHRAHRRDGRSRSAPETRAGARVGRTARARRHGLSR